MQLIRLGLLYCPSAKLLQGGMTSSYNLVVVQGRHESANRWCWLLARRANLLYNTYALKGFGCGSLIQKIEMKDLLDLCQSVWKWWAA